MTAPTSSLLLVALIAVVARLLDRKPGSMLARHRWQRRQIAYAAVALVALLGVLALDVWRWLA